MEQEIDLLCKTDIFRNLTAPQIARILEVGRKLIFPEGTVIMKEGDEGDTMYLIMEGTVEVAKSLVLEEGGEEAGEKNKVFTRLDATCHTVFGEMALLEKMRRTATIKAVTKCHFYEIERDAFLGLLEEDNELGYRILLNMARIISARLRKADEDTIKLTTALSIILRES